MACRVGRGDVHTGFWWGNLRERDHLKDLDVDGILNLMEKDHLKDLDVDGILNLREKDHLKDLDVDGILKLIFKE